MQSYIYLIFKYLYDTFKDLFHFLMAMQVLYLVFKKLASCGEKQQNTVKENIRTVASNERKLISSAIYTRLACVTGPLNGITHKVAFLAPNYSMSRGVRNNKSVYTHTHISFVCAYPAHNFF